jgi:hypothetical protein
MGDPVRKYRDVSPDGAPETQRSSTTAPRTKDWPTPMNSLALFRLRRLTPTHPAGPRLSAPLASRSEFSHSPAANSHSGDRTQRNIY